jgi:hypothetical protein
MSEVQELADKLRERSKEIAARVTDAMYQNPFWNERFGERGRRRAEEDAGYHVEYLAQALTARDAEVMRRYARWLQSVLTTRGMCTRHLDESFERVRAAVAVVVPQAQAASDYMFVARQALLYPAASGRELQLASARLAVAVADELHHRHPEWSARWGERGAAQCLDDIGYHLSYLADALALARSAELESYLVFIDGFLARRGVGGEHLRQTVQAIAEHVTRDDALSRDTRVNAGEMLTAGLRALDVAASRR